jgi:HNH endonuclease
MSGEKLHTKKVLIGPQILDLWDAGQPIAAIARELGCGTNTVRRLLDLRRPGERLARLSPPEMRTCTGCGAQAPPDQFPLRPDRPGVRHARCQACLLDWRRSYQKANPERNREGVRRRRARLRKSRTEAYRDTDIFDRDGGRCWFCYEEVDPELRYPDSRSMVIHHLHPISKSGPDIAKNVALAHYDCNQRAKDSYECPLREFVVVPISNAVARATIIQHHYLHRGAPASFSFGLFDSDDTLRGVVIFGSLTSDRIRRSITLAPRSEVTVLELNRLWIDDSVPFGAGSYFISRSLRQLPPALVVAYSDIEVTDPRYQDTHTGGVYRACSFSFAGTSRPNVDWRLPGKSRNVGKKEPGAVSVRVSPKTRYWTVTGAPADRRRLRTQSKWASLTWTPLAS